MGRKYDLDDLLLKTNLTRRSGNMSAVISKSKSRSKASAQKNFSGQSGFSEAEYREYLKSRSKIHNEVARKNRNTSIFDAMEAVEGEFKKKIYGGMSINEMFNNLK
jgi:hypothetical protein